MSQGNEFTERIHWVKQVPWDQYNIIRAGVIPYTVINNHVFICLGVDKQTQELTDFAGGVRTTDGTALSGGLREFREESKDVFGEHNYTESAYTDALCLIKRIPHPNRNMSYHMMVVFQEVDQSYLTDAMELFDNQLDTPKDEVSAIAWFDENMLKQLIYSPDSTRMYVKVKKFISSCICFNRLIYFLKLRSRLIKTVPVRRSINEDNSWIDEPRCSFKRRRVNEHRPVFNISVYTITTSCVA